MFIQQGIQFLISHPYIAAIVGTWVFNNIVTVMVSSLPAPTANSTPRYVYWFKVTNSITGNLKRAQSTAIEQSPNWEAAVNAHMQKINSGEIVVASAGTNPALPKPPTAL